MANTEESRNGAGENASREKGNVAPATAQAARARSQTPLAEKKNAIETAPSSRSTPAPQPQSDISESKSTTTTASGAAAKTSAPTCQPKATSQPITVSTSTSSSDAPTKEKDVTDVKETKETPKEIEVTPAQTYGTRSRNRGGSSRVNYAENEMDVEFETQVKEVKEDNPRKRKTQGGGGGGLGVAESRGGTPVPAAMPVKKETNGNAQVKDTIPGTSSFSLNAPVAGAAEGGGGSAHAKSEEKPAKKRKVAKDKESKEVVMNGAQALVTLATPTESSTPVPRINQSSNRESAMLSFQNSGAMLQDGRLYADDGTVLGVNGRLRRFHSAHSNRGIWGFQRAKC